MLRIDGGDGGGQLVRSALALSALSGRAVEVTDVRGDRPDPGLKHQHLAAVRALAVVADADVEGDALGSETVRFDPSTVRGGEYEVEIPTAGSVTLVFDAALPLAVGVERPLSLTATGGTDVKWSPSMAYYRRAKLPTLWRCGVPAAVEVDRTGFYPEGGGRATLRVAPADPAVSLVDRDDPRTVGVYSTAAAALADADVAARQAEAAADRLEAAGLDVDRTVSATADTDCPGSAVAVGVDYGTAVAGFDALGEPGRPAEDVGREAAEAALDHRESEAVVDRHMADQLLPFLAVAGGRVRVPAVTDHVESSVALFERFGYDLRVGDGPDPVVER